MKRIAIFLALGAILSASPLFAQTPSPFRSVTDGIWTDSHIWEKNESGVWLKPVEGMYPGERHNRNVDVTINDGSTVTIGVNEVVQINSLCILNGRVVVEGTLIVGPSKDDPTDPVTGDEGNTDPIVTKNDSADPVIITDNTLIPQLMQNVPNPLAPQFGYETTIKFYLDKPYSHVRLAIYDQLSHMIKSVFDEQNPATGWHTIRVRLDGIQSGSYPMVLELPNTVLRKMITVLR